MSRRTPRIVSALFGAGFALFFIIGTTHKARGYPPFLNQAQKLGFPAKDCLYCHTSPQGGTRHNARGNWLVTEKAKRKANIVDVSWLKEYESSKKPKAGVRAKKKL